MVIGCGVFVVVVWVCLVVFWGGGGFFNKLLNTFLSSYIIQHLLLKGKIYLIKRINCRVHHPHTQLCMQFATWCSAWHYIYRHDTSVNVPVCKHLNKMSTFGHRKGWSRSEPAPTTSMRYNSLFWMCTLNPYTQVDVYIVRNICITFLWGIALLCLVVGVLSFH